MAQQTGVQLGRESVRCVLKKGRKLLPSHRRLDPPRLISSALSRTCRPRVPSTPWRDHLLYEETILWRFALPRAGWWRKVQRARLLTRPLSQSQIKREEALKRQTWLRYRSWSHITSGVLLSVLGAVQYGTSKSSIKSSPF